MNEKDMDLKLLAGFNIEIESVGILHIPRLKEIINLGESVYSQYLSALLFDKNNIQGADTEDIHDFDLLFTFCYQDEAFRNVVIEAFEFIFKEELQFGSDESTVFFYFKSLDRRIDNNNFHEIQRIIKKANYLKVQSEPEYKAANSKAQEMMDLIEKNKKNRPSKKETMNLHSIISGLAWKDNGTSILNIFDLTIYQIYNGFFSTENIDNYHHTFTGIYTGNIDGKSIDYSKVHWAKILDHN